MKMMWVWLIVAAIVGAGAGFILGETFSAPDICLLGFGGPEGASLSCLNPIQSGQTGLKVIQAGCRYEATVLSIEPGTGSIPSSIATLEITSASSSSPGVGCFPVGAITSVSWSLIH